MNEITNENVATIGDTPEKLERDLIVKGVNNDPTVFKEWREWLLQFSYIHRLRENPKINKQILDAPDIESLNILVLFEAVNQIRGRIFDMDNYMNLETKE